MIFSTTLFLFIFLPIVLGLYFLINSNFRNIFILFASLFFYAWGEQLLVLVMMSSICINYVVGILISGLQKKEKNGQTNIALFIGVSINLLILGYYKYIHFLIDTLSQIGVQINVDLSSVTLPIGISFFTFQSISYLIDVYQKKVVGQKSIINLGMYISLFPQLIAGPIVRYADILSEIETRKVTTELFKDGISRFIVGFAKKVLIANNVGLIADQIFAIDPSQLSTASSWLGIICYTLQIYYDFSGYTDMAIGLGKMLGFNFKENFEHPYISTSIREFWRRWHISLSSWFKDYLYIPLGGNRKGKYRTYINLLIVFFLTGLWHGANWNFIIWGLFHGSFIVIERLNFVKLPSKLNFLSRIYTLLVVIVGWVLFRSENLQYAIDFMKSMFSFSIGDTNNYPYIFLNNYVLTILALGIVFSFPLKTFIEQKLELLVKNKDIRDTILHSIHILVFIFSIMELAQTTYNPFIYFRF